MASSLVVFVSQARGNGFYGNVASFGQHLTYYQELHKYVARMLLSGLETSSPVSSSPSSQGRITNAQVSHCL